MSADLYFTTDSSSSFFFFRPLISELAEWNSTISGHMDGSKCNLKIHVQNVGYPVPFISGAQKPPFWTTSQHIGNFNGLYLRNETRCRPSVKSIDNHRGLLHRAKMLSNLIHKRLQIGGKFSPTLRKFCIPLHCQASQMEISKRNSTKLCQTADKIPLARPLAEKCSYSKRVFDPT